MDTDQDIYSSKPELFSDLNGHRYNALVIDFDNTLLLGNSTELFIDNATPRGLAWLLALCGRIFAGSIYRDKADFARWCDLFRVRFVMFGIPWSYFFWKRNAALLAKQRLNWPLYGSLERHSEGSLIIASLGFRQLIAPLLPESNSAVTLVASSILPPIFNLRLKGKLAELEKHKIPWADTLAVSDSTEDLDLLRKAAKGYLIEWDIEGLRPPAYFPLRFTIEGKFSPDIFLAQHIKQDLVIICLAYYTDLRSLPLLLLLYFTFFTIYEIGYYENDYHASKFEATPIFHPGSGRFGQYSIYVSAWGWTIATLLLVSVFYSFRTASLWLVLLVGIRAIFYFYNRLSPRARMPLYVVLQGLKYFGYCFVLTPCFFGAIILGAQAIRQATNYIHYRITGKISALNVDLVRLGAFCILLGGALALIGKNTYLRESWSLQGCVILLWVSYNLVRKYSAKILRRLSKLKGIFLRTV